MEASLHAFTFLVLSFAAVSRSGTEMVVINNLADRSTINLCLGDSLVFKHRHLRNLFLFHNREAFDLCDFGDATIVYEGGSALFKWTPVRPGHYYLSTEDESVPSCEKGKKLLVRVIDLEISRALPPNGESAPPPTAGGDIPSYPAWGPSVSTGGETPLNIPPQEPNHGSTSPIPPPELGDGMPFISSNPAVPLPTGETVTSTFRPLPTPSVGSPQMVGFAASLHVGKLWLALQVIISSAFVLAS